MFIELLRNKKYDLIEGSFDKFPFKCMINSGSSQAYRFHFLIGSKLNFGFCEPDSQGHVFSWLCQLPVLPALEEIGFAPVKPHQFIVPGPT